MVVTSVGHMWVGLVMRHDDAISEFTIDGTCSNTLNSSL